MKVESVIARSNCGWEREYSTFQQALFHGEAHLLYDCSDKNCFVGYAHILTEEQEAK